jgi:transcriptional regulator with XRE-family HTH domain
MKLGEWLTAKRMSHEEFASRIGSDRSTVTRYVSGERMPRREMMGRILAETGGDVTANDFMTERDASADRPEAAA